MGHDLTVRSKRYFIHGPTPIRPDEPDHSPDDFIDVDVVTLEWRNHMVDFDARVAWEAASVIDGAMSANLMSLADPLLEHMMAPNYGKAYGALVYFEYTNFMELVANKLQERWEA